MTNPQKWTVRNVDAAALEMLHDVKELSGVPLGALVSEAVADWYSHLPESQEDVDEASLDHPTIVPESLEQLLQQFRPPPYQRRS
jgi:hypothetical protein